MLCTFLGHFMHVWLHTQMHTHVKQLCSSACELLQAVKSSVCCWRIVFPLLTQGTGCVQKTRISNGRVKCKFISAQMDRLCDTLPFGAEEKCWGKRRDKSLFSYLPRNPTTPALLVVRLIPHRNNAAPSWAEEPRKGFKETKTVLSVQMLWEQHPMRFCLPSENVTNSWCSLCVCFLF